MKIYIFVFLGFALPAFFPIFAHPEAVQDQSDDKPSVPAILVKGAFDEFIDRFGILDLNCVFRKTDASNYIGKIPKHLNIIKEGGHFTWYELGDLFSLMIGSSKANHVETKMFEYSTDFTIKVSNDTPEIVEGNEIGFTGFIVFNIDRTDLISITYYERDLNPNNSRFLHDIYSQGLPGLHTMDDENHNYIKWLTCVTPTTDSPVYQLPLESRQRERKTEEMLWG